MVGEVVPAEDVGKCLGVMVEEEPVSNMVGRREHSQS